MNFTNKQIFSVFFLLIILILSLLFTSVRKSSIFLTLDQVNNNEGLENDNKYDKMYNSYSKMIPSKADIDKSFKNIDPNNTTNFNKEFNQNMKMLLYSNVFQTISIDNPEFYAVNKAISDIIIPENKQLLSKMIDKIIDLLLQLQDKLDSYTDQKEK